VGNSFFPGEDPMRFYLFKYFIVLIFIGISLVYMFQVKKEHSLINKRKLDNLEYEGKMGQESLSNDPARPTVIIWFHPECENCRYQLDSINGSIKKLTGARFFFITADTNFFKNKFSIIWPELIQSPYVFFGIIDKSKFIDEFGPVVTPSLLLFNRGGILKEKLYGEVKIEKIIQLINKHPVPEQTMSGSN